MRKFVCEHTKTHWKTSCREALQLRQAMAVNPYLKFKKRKNEGRKERKNEAEVGRKEGRKQRKEKRKEGSQGRKEGRKDEWKEGRKDRRKEG